MTTRRKLTLTLGTLMVLLTLLGAVTVLGREPSLARTWDEDVRVLSGVDRLPAGSVRLTQVRDWRYTREAVVSKEYFAQVYDPAEVVGLWLYEQELGLGGLIAHTFLVFEFAESYGEARWLGLSVETRREVGETYSLVGGLLRAFEVTHVWASEEDLVTRRVELLDYPLTRYRVTVPEASIAAILRQFLDETAALATAPRWYNTLTTNCTNSLIGYVNEISPGAIPWHHSFVLTGRADRYLAGLGYVDLESAQPITGEWLAEHPLR